MAAKSGGGYKWGKVLTGGSLGRGLRWAGSWLILMGLWTALAGCGSKEAPSAKPLPKESAATASSSSPAQPSAGSEAQEVKPPEDRPSGEAKAQPSAGSAEPASLPEEIVRAWKEAGAEVGWMGWTRSTFGWLEFRSTKEELLRELPDFLKEEVQFLPAFRFRSWQEGLIRKLPEPTVAFGLVLSGSGITDTGLEELAGMKNLQVLWLSETQITDAGLVHLAGLKNLQRLALSLTRITDAGLVHLAGLKNLQGLNLSGTQITDAGLEKLAGMKLKVLRIPDEAKTDLGLKHYLAAIEEPSYLDLGGWKITDAGLVHLAGMKNLQHLYLEGTGITDAGLEKLQKALPRCRIESGPNLPPPESEID